MLPFDENIRDLFGRHLPNLRTQGRMIFDPVWAERMHRTNACELLYVVRGQMTLEFEQASFPAKERDVLIVPTGTMHRDVFDLDTELDIFYISFTWNLESEYIRQVNNRTIQAIPQERRIAMSLLFDPLQQDCGALDSPTKMLAEARVFTILMFLLREAFVQQESAELVETNGARGRLLLHEAKKYLRKHFAECIALGEVAAALRISPCHLSHVFSREDGFSMFSYLTQIRLEKAKTLLRDATFNVSEVARAVGYEDANYFAKVFRKHTGLSPREFAATTRQ
ncbi:MAG: AraC family transcriptional regulator [Candidatus Marinimicrobia bacterium]|nr:AraC family transcriptional regulator [Candidatus Neomarinimicrobiota bacterium]